MNSENENNWVFRLFISEETPKTNRAVAMLEQICEQHLEGVCDIKVIDITKDRLCGMEENIIATPTLIKKLPKPERRIIGDLLDKDELLLHLNIIK